MHRSSSEFVRVVLATVVVVVTAACGGAPPDTQDAAVEYRPTATIKDLMLSIIDESADVVWLAVSLEQSDRGVVETRPEDEDAWNRVRFGALALAESANLLIMPGRRVARPGEKSETPGVELEPEEMDELIAANRESWNRRALALHDAATKALEAIEARDADALFAIGEEIELSCEGCHSTFWYPNEQIPDLPDDFPSQ